MDLLGHVPTEEEIFAATGCRIGISGVDRMRIDKVLLHPAKPE